MKAKLNQIGSSHSLSKMHLVSLAALQYVAKLVSTLLDVSHSLACQSPCRSCYQCHIFGTWMSM